MTYLPFTRPSIDEETIADVAAVLRSGWLASGPSVLALESALSVQLDGRPVRSFTSGTAALEVALLVAGIGPGDEVIVPAMSFAASANVVLRVGARPVFADVDPVTRNLTSQGAEAALTPATRALMPVHFAGLAAEMDALHALAHRRGLRVIEDAAHAIGTRSEGRLIGSFGDLVAFSFHANKNITTGEGGALVLNDEAETAAAELHRFHGIRRDADGLVDVVLAGGKANLTDIAAALGLGQLRRLEAFNARRRHLAGLYFEALADEDALELPTRGDAGHAWHMFAPLLRLERLTLTRPQFIAALHERGIGVGVHYPAIPGLTAYRGLGWSAGQFPVAERIGRCTITLPLFPAMADDDVARVCTAVRAVLAGARR